MRNTILFVAAGGAQCPGLIEARQAGYYTVAMDGDPNAPGFALADEKVVSDIRFEENIVEAAKEYGVAGIVCLCCDAALESTAHACEALGLPGVSRETAKVSANKYLQRKRASESGLPTPGFLKVTEMEEALQAWEELRNHGACVVKPTDSSGSRGVRFVDSRKYVASAFEAALAFSKSGEVLVESFMPGTEYSVEGWLVDGGFQLLASSEKVRTNPPYLLDREVHFPDLLLPADRKRMVDLVAETAVACGMDNCPLHAEVIFSSGNPFVVEIAARGAGFRVFTEMIPRVTGFSTTVASINASLGKEIDFSPLLLHQQSAASISFIDPVPGILADVSGIDAARAVQGVDEIEIYARIGDLMSPLESGANRAGHIIAYANDGRSCRAVARKANSLIKFAIEEESPATQRRESE